MLSDFKSTLLSLTRNVTRQSGDLIRTTKLTVSLAQEQEALKNLYTEIGKKVHEIYQYGGSLGKFFDEKYREIENAEKKIESLREEVAKIKGVKACPKCGKQVEKAAEFCPRCGLRLEAGVSAGNGGAVPDPVRPAAGSAPPETADRSAPPEASMPFAETALPALPPELPAPPAKIICRVCGTENEAGAKFCLSCGRSL